MYCPLSLPLWGSQLPHRGSQEGFSQFTYAKFQFTIAFMPFYSFSHPAQQDTAFRQPAIFFSRYCWVISGEKERSTDQLRRISLWSFQ